MANEGLVRDSLLKMFHNPGGDWHPGWGVDLMYVEKTFENSKTWQVKRKMDVKPPEI